MVISNSEVFMVLKNLQENFNVILNYNWNTQQFGKFHKIIDYVPMLDHYYDQR